MFNNTSWNLYKSFLVVYEAGNLHRAADRLGISRAAIRQNITELGNQLGVTLFVPHRRGVMPTGDASNIYPNIKDAVAKILEAENATARFTRESTGNIKIATTNTHVMMYLADYMKTFREAFPCVTFEFFGLESKSLLESGGIDFILDTDAFFRGTDFKTANLFKVNPIFAASKEFAARHGLTGVRPVPRDVFSGLPLITLRPYMDDLGLESAEGVGAPGGAIKAESLDMTYQFIRANLGVGYFCHELLQSIGDSNIIEIHVAGAELRPSWVVCGYNKALSRPARAFVDGLKQWCETKKCE